MAVWIAGHLLHRHVTTSRPSSSTSGFVADRVDGADHVGRGRECACGLLQHGRPTSRRVPPPARERLPRVALIEAEGPDVRVAWLTSSAAPRRSARGHSASYSSHASSPAPRATARLECLREVHRTAALRVGPRPAASRPAAARASDLDRGHAPRSSAPCPRSAPPRCAPRRCCPRTFRPPWLSLGGAVLDRRCRISGAGDDGDVAQLCDLLYVADVAVPAVAATTICQLAGPEVAALDRLTQVGAGLSGGVTAQCRPSARSSSSSVVG